jgi:hypothetical protein
MKRPFLFLALLLPLAFWLGCAVDEQPATQVLGAGQIQLLVPSASKEAGTDDLMDLHLSLRPNRPATATRPGVVLFAPRGCVEQPLTITGDWQGDEVDLPAIGYDFSPDGTEFLLPLRIQFLLLPCQVVGIDPSRLTVVLDLEDGSYEIVPTEVDILPGAVVLRAPLEHFSKYLVAVGPQPEGSGSTQN